MSSEPSDTDPAAPESSGSPLPADEMLPPVEPPNARFLIQLFVVPALIVLMVVGLWLLVTSMASSDGQDPEKIVSRLRSSNQNRWQEAYELANMLQVEKRYPKLRRNTKLADELAKLLAEEMELAQQEESEEANENAVKLRMFLCSALGAFKVDQGLSELLIAAQDDVDLGVRRAAIDAIAIRAQSAQETDEPHALEHEDLVSTLEQLANDQDDLIRSQTAYALGVVTQAPDVDPLLIVELEKLVDDLNADTRYNAALALARGGNLRAVSAIAEMLDRDAIAISISREEQESYQTYKRNIILRNALEGAATLMAKNPDVELPELRTAIEKFVAEAPSWEDHDPSLQALVEQAQEILDDETPSTSSE